MKRTIPIAALFLMLTAVCGCQPQPQVNMSDVITDWYVQDVDTGERFGPLRFRDQAESWLDYFQTGADSPNNLRIVFMEPHNGQLLEWDKCAGPIMLDRETKLP